jgi:hypothetical protein
MFDYDGENIWHRLVVGLIFLTIITITARIQAYPAGKRK